MPVSTAALKQIAASGLVISLGGAAYFYKKIQDNVAAGSYYAKSIEIVSQHRGATEVLGLPIRTKFINLGDQFNAVTALQANLAIPVRGSIRRGKMFTWSARQSTQDDWTVNRIDLEVENPQRKVTIYVAPPSDETQAVEEDGVQPLDSSFYIGDR